MRNLLEQEEIITSPKKLSFTVERAAWYVVSITARVRSEKQRGQDETDDEELTLQLDSITFPKPSTDNDLRDAPAAFSGGSQHDKEKTVQILIALSQGNHTLILTPQHRAQVVSVWYESQTLIENKLILKLKEQSADRREQPWLTFALVSQHFTQATVNAKVWWHFLNGDDLQIRINGTIVPHATNKVRHKYWVFHARPILDLFGREQTEVLELFNTSPEQKITYVELWADRTPVIQEIIFEGDDLQKDIITANKLHQYSKGIHKEDNNKYDEIIENVVNELNQHFLSQAYPPPEPLDPNLVKAMMYVESKMGYYQAPSGSYPSSPDVMQIADARNPAIHTLNHDSWIDPSTGQKAEEYIWTPKKVTVLDYDGKAKVNSVQDSVYWAVIWLYHKAEIINQDNSRSWRAWPDAVTRYNGGGDLSYGKKVYEINQKGDWK